jgi:glyoxylase I family protein
MTFTAEHFGLAAAEPTALRDWYMRVLGAKPLRQLSDSPPAYLIELGNLWIELYAAESSPGRQGNRVAGWRHLALRVENIEAARKDLEAKGVVFPEPVKPAGGGGQVLFFSDPEGNLFHLVERPRPW